MKKINISELVNTQYKEFSKYVCFNRAIPSLIDGFKPSQRKSFYCLKGKDKQTKVMALAGEMISNCNYHHGDSSACETIIKMSQDFCGANNLPPFLKEGSFGNRLVTEASAARYIYSKPNPNFYKLYKDYEITISDEDLDNPEPYYYLPIIPTILLNGVSGIAVGFATEIQPYDIKDIKKYIINFIKNEKTPKLVPYYKDYKGTIEFDKEIEKYVMYGIYNKINTSTIQVLEIPVNMNRERYINHLNSLIDKNIISSFIDDSKKSWNITIKLSRSSKLFNDPIKYLKLKYILNENITILDENRNIIVFNNVYELIDHFIKFRLSIYNKRKKYMMSKIKDNILFNQTKIKFIKLMCRIDFKNMSKKNIREFILNKGCKEKYLDKLMSIKVYNLSNDEIIKCKNEINGMKKEYDWYKDITIKELYDIDLGEI